MAKERKSKSKPETPPEVAAAQKEAALAALPGNMPKYLLFKPSEDTTVAFTQLNAVLSIIDQKLRTSNHVQPHTMMQEQVLPAFLQFADWLMRSQRDLVEYSQHVASWAAEQHMVVAMNSELGNHLLEHFKAVRTTVTEIKAMMDVTQTDESKKMIADKLNKIADEGDELGKAVEEEDWDDEFEGDDDEEPADDDEDDYEDDDDFDPETDDEDDDEFSDEDDEDEDEEEPEPDLVETTSGKVKPKKSTTADDEPLF